MDADLSHPPEVIPDFIAALDGGADFVVGSRYVPGGSTEDGWGVLRWINSKIATWMARPFTTVRDPMSGFLGFRRETWASAVDLDPVGYKIGLELIVKCRCRHVTEVPIHFSTRRHGESKLSLRVQLQYLTHIVRLARWKFPGWSSFVPFAVVGLSGVAVYAFLLWLLQAWLGERVSEDLQIIIAIAITMVWNFIFDRWLAFWYARKQSIVRQFVGFLAVCSIPVIVNFFVTRWLIGDEIVTPAAGVIGALVGSAAGVIFNWVVVRAIVFRAQARAGGD
jgi:dolichol-phosphate mannosyltransferase